MMNFIMFNWKQLEENVWLNDNVQNKNGFHKEDNDENNVIHV